MAGRLETYMHSDSTTANKGVAVVAVRCQTDFAARTNQFKAFAKDAARMAYGAGAESWDAVVATFPDMETQRQQLAEELRESITVEKIVVMAL